MKLFFYALLLFPSVVSSQSQNNPHNIDREWNFIRPSATERSNVNCGVDTVLYVQAKTTSQETKILYSDGNAYSSMASQYFHASAGTPITVHGFRWYGVSYDPVSGGNPVLTIDCSVYQAGSDSLPTGAPLATITLTVDTTSANQVRDVVFASPVVMTSSYTLVVSNQNTDWLLLASNDEDSNDGQAEELSASFYEPIGQWRKNMNLWALGDFDFVMEPFVSYTMDADFDNPGTGCVGIPVDFNNTSKGPIKNKFYNTDQFYGGPISYSWDYGDANTSYGSEDGQNTYGAPGVYTVSLTDSIRGWNTTCWDTVSSTIEIFPIPSAPSSTPPTPVCEYTPANDLTATGSGTDFTWYGNAGLTNVLGTGSPFSSGIILPDTVYVTETVNGCESPGTEVIIDFLPNPIPTWTAVNTGGNTFDFTGPSATFYSWDFGDGTGTSTQQSPTYTYSAQAAYNVCLDVTYSNSCTNQYCETVSLLSVDDLLSSRIQVYPNPVADVLSISTDGLKINSVQVFSSEGRLVMSKQIFDNQSVIDCSALSSGVYHVIIETSEGTAQKKIVKK